jgi:hypothetical protein
MERQCRWRGGSERKGWWESYDASGYVRWKRAISDALRSGQGFRSRRAWGGRAVGVTSCRAQASTIITPCAKVDEGPPPIPHRPQRHDLKIAVGMKATRIRSIMVMVVLVSLWACPGRGQALRVVDSGHGYLGLRGGASRRVEPAGGASSRAQSQRWRSKP